MVDHGIERQPVVDCVRINNPRIHGGDEDGVFSSDTMILRKGYSQ